jgi:hypothetical protein
MASAKKICKVGVGPSETGYETEPYLGRNAVPIEPEGKERLGSECSMTQQLQAAAGSRQQAAAGAARGCGGGCAVVLGNMLLQACGALGAEKHQPYAHCLIEQSMRAAFHARPT